MKFVVHHLALVTSLTLCSIASAVAAPSVVVDKATGAVLHAQDAFEHWSPASLTKLMTAYVTFKAIRDGELALSAPVRMSEAAASVPPAKMGYGVGSVMTVDNALKMLIVKSANDIAVALAEAVSGSVPEFVERMNAEARALGMRNTRFANPHGLDDSAQYSTARDIALLASTIRREFPEHDAYFATEAIRTGEEVTPTYNILLGRFANADGMKTGFVCVSGFNMVASATRNGRTLIAVVLGEGSQKARAEKSATLLEAGFAGTLSQIGSIGSFDGPDADGAVADVSGAVCSEEARNSRWDGRAIEGFITFDTPSITALTRAPVAVRAGLGGADGTSRSASMFNGVAIGALPIPQPKPERPSIPDATDVEAFGLKPGFDVPIPRPRP